jgi:hypothetical protein
MPPATEQQLDRIGQTLRSLELERAERIKATHAQAAPIPPVHRTGDASAARAGVPLRTRRTRGARWGRRRPAPHPDPDAASRTAARTG